MNANDEARLSAFRMAGHDALEAVAQLGHEHGAEVVRGMFEAYLLAHAAMHGWGRTFEIIRERSRGQYVPARGATLHLVVSNSAEVVHRELPTAS